MNTIWKKIFGRHRLEQPREYLICGGRRTGTTLLAAIFSSDERANPLGQEAQILTRIVEAYRWGRENFDTMGRSFFADEQDYLRFFQDTVARFSRDVAARISPGGVIVLKNPELSMVALDAAELFPNAQLWATIRDPRDQVASELEVGARRRAAGIPDSIFDSRNVVALAAQYATYNAEIHRLREKHPDRTYTVRYEDLVLNPEDTLQDLRHRTGLSLSFDPERQWSRVSSLAALDTSPSRSDLYGRPIEGRSVGRFRRDLAIDEIVAIEETCASLMSEYGY